MINKNNVDISNIVRSPTVACIILNCKYFLKLLLLGLWLKIKHKTQISWKQNISWKSKQNIDNYI